MELYLTSKCPKQMNVDWWQLAPYIFYQNGIETGILKKIVEMSIRVCCSNMDSEGNVSENDFSFTYLKAVENYERLTSDIGHNNTVIAFPVYGKTNSDFFLKYPYFPVIQIPGYAYLQDLSSSKTASEAVLEAVKAGWPIMILALFTAILFGIIIWALDSNRNPIHFPRPFYKGSWEGIWWAFVAMTTVGYGDRIPKSCSARMFSFLIILFGMSLIGIFTSTVSSSLISYLLNKDISLFSKSIVVLNQTEEHRFALRHNAKVIPVDNMKDFVKTFGVKMKEGIVEGGLVDTNVAGYYRKLVGEQSGIRLGKVFDSKLTYGFIILKELNNPRFNKCLRRTLSNCENDINNLILNKDNLQALKEPQVDISTSLLNERSTIFQRAMYLSVGAIVFLILVGIVWEYFYWRPKQERRISRSIFMEKKGNITRYNTSVELYCDQYRQLEDFLVYEVTEFYNKFNRKMAEIGEIK